MPMSTSLLHHSRVKIVTNYIRYTRMARHYVIHALTGDMEHFYEIDHYRYMKKFSNIK
jgi:hypothetical protein